jgi:hypothetical protein
MSANVVEHQPPSKRSRRSLISKWGCALSMAAYCGFVLGSVEHGWMIWPALAFAAVAIVFACGWMAFIDEAAQQAHYIAWFWGGSLGLTMSSLALLALMPQLLNPVGVERLRAPYGAMPDTSFAFFAGVAFMILPASIGYMIWWAALWLRRR